MSNQEDLTTVLDRLWYRYFGPIFFICLLSCVAVAAFTFCRWMLFVIPGSW